MGRTTGRHMKLICKTYQFLFYYGIYYQVSYLIMKEKLIFYTKLSLYKGRVKYKVKHVR